MRRRITPFDSVRNYYSKLTKLIDNNLFRVVKVSIMSRSDIEEDLCPRVRYSASPLDLKQKPINNSPPKSKKTSFCIEALLGHREVTRKTSLTASSDCSSTPCSSRSASISPGPEQQFGYEGKHSDDNETISTATMRSLTYNSNYLKTDFPITSSSTEILTRDHRRNGSFGFIHGSSAFQPLPRIDTNTNNSPGSTVVTAPETTINTNRSNVSAGQLQQMQLEWFARAGMFYAGPRLHDLTGNIFFNFYYFYCLMCLVIFNYFK